MRGAHLEDWEKKDRDRMERSSLNLYLMRAFDSMERTLHTLSNFFFKQNVSKSKNTGNCNTDKYNQQD